MKTDLKNKLQTLLVVLNESDLLDTKSCENLFSCFPAIEKEGVLNLIIYIDILKSVSAGQKKELVSLLKNQIMEVSQKFSFRGENLAVIENYDEIKHLSSPFSVYFVLGLGGREELKKILPDFVQEYEKTKNGKTSFGEKKETEKHSDPKIKIEKQSDAEDKTEKQSDAEDKIEKQSDAEDKTEKQNDEENETGKQIDAKNYISNHLKLPFEPDLIFSCSGHFLTDFMIWQTAYSEYYFVEKSAKHLKQSDFSKAFESYRKRERRYGA